jgi:S-formylglutathione hydrolase FrmB
MPQVHRSFYTDEHMGNRYWTFLSEELPAVVDSFFKVSSRREDTFVAGLSMGGYGAFKWALQCPDRFAAAASLSGALDIATLQSWDERNALMHQVFGPESVQGTEHDLFTLLDRAVASGRPLPSLFAACGTEDPLVGSTRAFADAAAARGVDLRLELVPGSHDWELWDRLIQDVLAWLPLR